MNIVQMRRGMGNGLPYDSQIQYLQSTGTQIINTGIPQNSVYGFDIYINQVSTANARMVYLGVDNYGTSNFLLTTYAGRTNELSFNGFGKNFSSLGGGNPARIYTLGGYLYHDATNRGALTTSYAGTSQLPIFMYRSYPNGYKSSIRIYWCKLYGENGELIYDAIPVRKGSVGYMYDRVSGKLFGDISIEQLPFTLGPDMHSEFSYVQYIDVTNKYLETDIDAINVGGLYFRYSWVSQQGKNIIHGGNFRIFYRAWVGFGSIDVRGVNIGSGTVGNTVRNGSADNVNSVLSMRSTDDLKSIILTGSGSETYPFEPGALSSTSGNISCFNNASNGGRRIYELKLYDTNGDLIFNGLPVRLGNIGALYDSINNKYYTWNGVGDYGYGPDVVPPV